MPKDELIAALEKATGPASGFDMMIANHLYPGDLDMQRAARDGRWSPTKSIDAALTLVPEGAIRHIEWCEGFVEVAVFTERYSLAHGAAPTPALAICIAALASERGEAGR